MVNDSVPLWYALVTQYGLTRFRTVGRSISRIINPFLCTNIYCMSEKSCPICLAYSQYKMYKTSWTYNMLRQKLTLILKISIYFRWGTFSGSNFEWSWQCLDNVYSIYNMSTWWQSFVNLKPVGLKILPLKNLN